MDTIVGMLLETRDLPNGFKPIPPTGPVNHRAEHPPRGDEPDPGRTPTQREGRARLVDQGLRGGYQRAWRNIMFDEAGGGLPEHVHVCVYEWITSESAEAVVGSVPAIDGSEALELPGTTITARVLRHPDSPAFCGTIFAVGPLSCQVDVQGGRPDRHDSLIGLARSLIVLQVQRLQSNA